MTGILCHLYLRHAILHLIGFDPIGCLHREISTNWLRKWIQRNFGKFTIANYSARGLWGNQFILGQIKKLSSKLVFIPPRRHQNTIIARHATFHQKQNSYSLLFIQINCLPYLCVNDPGQKSFPTTSLVNSKNPCSLKKVLFVDLFVTKITLNLTILHNAQYM